MHGDIATPLFALVLGSAATLIPKVLLRTGCDASCAAPPRSTAFDGSVWATGVVFIAAIAGLCGEKSWQALAKRRKEFDTAAPAQPLFRFSVLLLPGTLSVGSVLLQLYSLTLVPAAVLAGLRGFLILFTALLSAYYRLKDAPKLRAEWICIAGSALGAVLVGAAAWLQPGSANTTESGDDAHSDAFNTVLGLGVATLGYGFAAIQVTSEQLLLDGKGFSKWEIMGVEGVWGLLICVALSAALAAAGATQVEVPSHTLCCLRTTPMLWGWSVAYGSSSLAFNFCLLLLASALGANWRVFIFTARGLLTLFVEATLYYAAPGASMAQSYGEPLSPFSVLTVAGYGLLIGTGLYRTRLQQRGQQSLPSGAATIAGVDGSGSISDEPRSPVKGDSSEKDEALVRLLGTDEE